MSKVLVDPATLEEAAKWLEVHSSSSGSAEAFAAEALREAIAQPAEAEGVEVVAWRYTSSQAFGRRDRRWHYQETSPEDGARQVQEIGQLDALVRESDHLADLSSVTAERDRLAAENEQLKHVPAQELLERVEALRKDKARLDAIEQECWDVRLLSSPNGDAGDSSISIEIVGHFMAEPCERVVGENYNENLRAALDQAMTAEAYPPARPEYDEYGRPLIAVMAAKESTHEE